MSETPSRGSRDRPVRDHLIAAGWGAAEATFLFIVPDVWLTRIATRSPARAMRASVSALIGALAGGALTYTWGRMRPAAETRRALRRLPAISGAMITRCEEDLDRRGTVAMLSGPLRGVPYKIYARTAGLQRRSPAEFAGWSIPARIPRFLLVSLLAAGITRLSTRLLGEDRTSRLAPGVHLLLWIAFYSWYLRVVGREAPGSAS